MSSPDMSTPLKLLYVYDALCGWCYGFSPVLGSLLADRPGATVEVVSGGMIRGARRGPIGEVAGYIKQAYKVVEERCGVTFGRDFVDGPLEAGTMYMTSEPPAALLAAAREAKPAEQYAAAHALQTGIYYHGLGPDTDELARHLARGLDLPEDSMVEARTAECYRRLAEEDFARSQQLGVTGFPVLLMAHGGQYHLLAHGYVDRAALDGRIAAVGEGR